MAKKKLIEVALPLDAINEASAREKSIRHGHPSTLHLWWARRPLAAARAVIFSSLVDDPSSHPDKFPTEKDQEKERQRLFDILERLVTWENSNDEKLLAEAKAEIERSTDGNVLEFLDPFAGGGAIPLEAQRLGLKAHAADLNPVAVMINKAMIEIPPKFQGMPPVNPEARAQLGSEIEWKGSTGLAEDVRYYGEWMREEAFKQIGHLYPKATLPDGSEATVIAWIWARTVTCPNPACGCEMPLVRSFDLSTKKGKEHHIELDIQDSKITYEVKRGKAKVLKGTMTRTGATCPCCGTFVDLPYIREFAQHDGLGSHLMAIVGEGSNGRLYLSPTEEHINIAQMNRPKDYPSGKLSGKARVSVPLYGMDETADLFTNRQLTALTTFSSLVSEAQKKVYEDAIKMSMLDDGAGLDNGGVGAKAYGEAVGVYLALSIDRVSDRNSSVSSWDSSRDGIRNVFGRQAIPMVWDYAEANPFSNSTGSFLNANNWIIKVIENFLLNTTKGKAEQRNVTVDNNLRNIVISTDPPYYDNIGYADLSDFFYIWMRQSIKATFPSLFSTMLVPKAEELVATPYRFEGGAPEAKQFFEDGMLKAFEQIHAYTCDDIPVTIYYAFKQSETKEDQLSSNVTTASTGWETMLSALIRAGFTITGTWPMRTEMTSRAVAQGSNALASSIVLVCRKRAPSSAFITRKEFIATLKKELYPALHKLQQANIAPVDLAQSAIGPGMAVYSRNGKILEADGTEMSVRSALEIVNEMVDEFFNEQEGEMDVESRFCVDLFSQYAFNPVRYGTAEVLSKAKNISIDQLVSKGVLTAKMGEVYLNEREDLPKFTVVIEYNVWLTTQQIVYAFQEDGLVGATTIMSRLPSHLIENVKALAYRLYTISERKGWANEAYVYNSLVSSWMTIQERATSEDGKYVPGELDFD